MTSRQHSAVAGIIVEFSVFASVSVWIRQQVHHTTPYTIPTPPPLPTYLFCHYLLPPPAYNVQRRIILPHARTPVPAQPSTVLADKQVQSGHHANHNLHTPKPRRGRLLWSCPPGILTRAILEVLFSMATSPDHSYVVVELTRACVWPAA